jgi:protease I
METARQTAGRAGRLGPKVLLIVAPTGFHDEELSEAKALLEARGASVEIASTAPGVATGMQGARVAPSLVVDAVDPHAYVAVVVIGGSGAPAYLWENTRLHALIRAARADGTPVAAIGRAAVALARAGVLDGIRSTVFGAPRAKRELLRAGALYVDDHVVVDQGIVTASGHTATPTFARAVADEIKVLRQGPPSA